LSRRFVPAVCRVSGTGSGTLAEKFKLSIPSPCALPVASGICHTSHRAAPGGQLVIVWLSTPRLVWFSAAVPSTATPPTSAATVGKLTFSAGRKAVALVGKALVPVGSTI